MPKGNYQSTILPALRERFPESKLKGICHGLGSMVAIPFLARNPEAISLVLAFLEDFCIRTPDDPSRYEGILRLIHHLHYFPTVEKVETSAVTETKIDETPSNSSDQTGQKIRLSRQEILFLGIFKPEYFNLLPAVSGILHGRREDTMRSLTGTALENCVIKSTLSFQLLKLALDSTRLSEFCNALSSFSRPSVITLSILKHTIFLFFKEDGGNYFLDANRGFFEYTTPDEAKGHLESSVSNLIPEGCKLPPTLGARITISSADTGPVYVDELEKLSVSAYTIPAWFNYFWVVLANKDLATAENIAKCLSEDRFYLDLSNPNFFNHAKDSGTLGILLKTLYQNSLSSTLQDIISSRIKDCRAAKKDLEIFGWALELKDLLSRLQHGILDYSMFRDGAGVFSFHGKAGKERAIQFSNLLKTQLEILNTFFTTEYTETSAAGSLLEIRNQILTHFNREILGKSRQNGSLESRVEETIEKLKTAAVFLNHQEHALSSGTPALAGVVCW